MKKRVLNLKTYIPEDKIRLQKEGAVPFLMDAGAVFSTFSDIVSFFITSFIVSIKTFWKTKRKIREFQAKHEKIMDLRD